MRPSKEREIIRRSDEILAKILNLEGVDLAARLDRIESVLAEVWRNTRPPVPAVPEPPA